MTLESEFDTTTPREAERLVRETLHRIGEEVYTALDDFRSGKGDPLATIEAAAQALLFIADDLWVPSLLSVENLKV